MGRTARSTGALALCLPFLLACALPAKDPGHPDAIEGPLDEVEGSLSGTAPPDESRLATLNRILREHEIHHRSLLLRARLLLALQRPREALRDLDRLVAAYPPEPETAALRGRALLETGRPRDARRAFRQALDLDPRQPAALTGLGLILSEIGAFEEASRYFGRAHELAPDDARARSLFAAARAIRSAPESARALPLPQERAAAGRLLISAGRAKLGTEVLLTLLKESPDDPELLKAAASGLSRQGHLAHAQALLERAVSLRPRDPRAVMALAGVLARRSAADPSLQPRASRLFEEAASLAPGDVRPHLAAAELHARSGGILDALRCFKAAEAADPSSPEPAVDHGFFLASRGDLGGAVAVYRRALEKHPEHAPLLANLMAALYELGRANEAGRLRSALEARDDLDPRVKSVLDAYSGVRR